MREVKLEILFGGSVYVLTGGLCERLLAGLDADAGLGQVLGTLRDDLRRALSAAAAGGEGVRPFENPFGAEGDETAAAEGGAAPAFEVRTAAGNKQSCAALRRGINKPRLLARRTA